MPEGGNITDFAVAHYPTRQFLEDRVINILCKYSGILCELAQVHQRFEGSYCRASYRSSARLFFYHEDGDNMFLRNVSFFSAL
jgi:hypothetical protein